VLTYVSIASSWGWSWRLGISHGSSTAVMDEAGEVGRVVEDCWDDSSKFQVASGRESVVIDDGDGDKGGDVGSMGENPLSSASW